MKKVILLVALGLPFLFGCTGNSFIFTDNPDGYYEGWVSIDRPGLGFDESFVAHVKVWDDGTEATIRDDDGDIYDADYVEFDFWDNRLEIFFRVFQTKWDPECGREEYRWEVRMSGKLRFSRYYGNIEVDIDPEDYYSEECYLDFDPPPRYVGSFDLDYDHTKDIW